MADILKMAKMHSIIGLLENKWTHRRIARELGVDWETVARYHRFRNPRKIINIRCKVEEAGDKNDDMR